MNIDQITKLLSAISSLDAGQVEHEKEKHLGWHIVIGNRGNIVVGDLTIVGGAGYLKDASVIRRWGTDKGLGQLALEGEQTNTVLDYCGSFRFELLTTCGMIEVKSDFGKRK